MHLLILIWRSCWLTSNFISWFYHSHTQLLLRTNSILHDHYHFWSSFSSSNYSHLSIISSSKDLYVISFMLSCVIFFCLLCEELQMNFLFFCLLCEDLQMNFLSSSVAQGLLLHQDVTLIHQGKVWLSL